MKITFLGGADEVGASCTLIEIAGKKLLVDAGIRISPKSNKGIESSQLPDLKVISDVGGIDYVLVTHAHTDHTGALPLVMQTYPQVPVLMTRPTEALVRVLQQDAQRIMTSNYEEEGELPLFDEVAVNALMNAIQIVEYNKQVRLAEGLTVTYHVSGHIAGAAMLIFDSVEGTLVMSGDVSKSPQRTVESVKVPRVKADVVVLESTYGGRMHANREAEERRLIESIQRVIERGGKVLIPAFALGRAQEILQIILAYREEINAPVYADGMVRSVCQAYTGFANILPNAMIKAAGDQPLFFRSNIHAVSSTSQRRELASADVPIVVVASSGMLTGGASQFYAQEFAPNERNAIFMTGYQDEEAPGKRLQQLVADRAKGETTVKLGKQTVTVLCEIGTYSLSAHADESELIAIAKAFKPHEVLLVHGDANARHSLASGLRQREMAVSLPRVGTTKEYTFASRPWALANRVSEGKQDRSIDLATLWNELKTQAGSYFDVRELAKMWFGDVNREAEVASHLAIENGVYFSGDWRQRGSFRVNSPEQVERARKQRAIMVAHPSLLGQLIVLRNSSGAVHLGIVKSADVAQFEAIVEGTKGATFAADTLLWALGEWREPRVENEPIRAQLASLTKRANAFKDLLLPIEKRRELFTSAIPIDPATLLPDELPEGATKQDALAAIVLALADDHAEWTPNGLVTKRVLEVEPMEQNEARDLALELIPVEAQVRKVGLNITRKELLLSFDFPSVVQAKYQDVFADIAYRSGWSISVNPVVNQQALIEAVSLILPDSAILRKAPSYFMDKKEVAADIGGLFDSHELTEKYRELTGFRLRLPGAPVVTQEDSAPTGTLWEINAAYKSIRDALEPFGLYKTSLKNNEIVLAFISPQVAKRHEQIIARLSEETGYRMSIHPHPNQQEMLSIVRRYTMQKGWQISKSPGIRTDELSISLQLATVISEQEIANYVAFVNEKTGYRLVLG